MADKNTFAAKQWKFVTAISETILSSDGIIFGEFVREAVYYEHIRDTIEPDRLPTPPTKISGVMEAESVTSFLQNCRFSYMKVEEEHAVATFGNELADQIIRRFRVSLDEAYWRQVATRFPVPMDTQFLEESTKLFPSIAVELRMTGNLELGPFIHTLDFECNGLYLTRKGLLISNQVNEEDFGLVRHFNTLNRVVKDIHQKKAKIMFSTNHTLFVRAAELMQEGWTIYDDTLTTSNNPDGGVCLLCHDDLPATHFKMQCCNARYHGTCLKTALAKGYKTACLMCRTPCLFDTRHYVLLPPPAPITVTPCASLYQEDVD
jgi:hypothetical protein